MSQFAANQWCPTHAFVHVVLIFVAVLAVGCGSVPLSVSPPQAPQPVVVQSVPTVNPMFAHTERPVELTPSEVVNGTLSHEQLLGKLVVEPVPVANSRPAETIVDEPVFDDELSAGWSTDQSIGVTAFFTDTEHAYVSNVGIAVTPQQDFGMLFFTVEQDAEETYGLDRVAGVSVWINSGEQSLDPNNLSITVVGSNDYTYWTPDDTSVETNETHFFSESRLYYLGVKNTVPPNTWVEAVVWLDKLPYEPDYKYVTGIYIKNDEWFRRTFYVDQIHLLVVK